MMKHQYQRPLPAGHALSIFGIQEIAGELTAILEATAVDNETEVTLSEDEWASFISSFSACLGVLPPSSDT